MRPVPSASFFRRDIIRRALLSAQSLMMRPWIAVLLTASALISIPGLSEEKKRDWQTGKLISIEEPARGSVAIVKDVSPPRLIVVNYKIWIYRVEIESTTWVFVAGGKGHEHPRPFTVGKEVKFALDSKGNAYLIDEQGKELKALEAMKAAKRAESPAP